jgi:hypothetical protein
MASFGIDATIKNNVNITVDLYNTINTNLLLAVPTATSTGFFEFMDNRGTVRNRGIEFAIDGTILKLGDFRWDAGFNIGFNQNRVISLPDGDGNGIPGPFSPVYTDGVLTGLTNCIFCAERQFVSMGDQTISSAQGSTGYVVLTITHPSTSADAGYSTGAISLDTSGSLPSNTTDNTVTKIPLFHITNGVVDVDLRAVPTAVLAK